MILQHEHAKLIQPRKVSRNYKSEAPSILSDFLFQTKNLVKEVLVTLHRDDLIEAGNTSS